MQPVGARRGQPVVEDRDLRAAGARRHERRALDARRVGVAEEGEGQGGDGLAHPGPAALLGEDGAAVLGVLAADGVEAEHAHHVGHPGRRQDHLVAPGVEGDLPVAPVEASPDLLLHRLERGVDGGHSDPGRPAAVGRAADQAHGRGGLGVREAQPGRAAQVERLDVDLGEAGQHGVAAAGTLEGSAERREDGLERAGVGLLGFLVEGAADAGRLGRLDQCEGVLGRRGRLGVGQRGGHHVGHPVDAHDARTAGRADGAGGDHDDADGAAALHSVGRGAVEGVAHVGVAALLDEHDAAVGPELARRRRRRPRRPLGPGSPANRSAGHRHRPASSRC